MILQSQHYDITLKFYDTKSENIRCPTCDIFTELKWSDD